MSCGRANRPARAHGRAPIVALGDHSGQALVLMLAVVGALLAGALLLMAFGHGVGWKGRYQRAADLAAVSAARSMRDSYPRLFEPSFVGPGRPNPRHLGRAGYLAGARAAAVDAGRRNGVAMSARDVVFPDASSIAPVRVTVALYGEEPLRVGRASGAVGVRARATAELVPPSPPPVDAGARGAGGGYQGPLAYRMGKPMRPAVAAAFDDLAAAAWREIGVALSIQSAFRSDDEQARLFAANPNPRWVAPAGTSLHRYATELDLGPPAAYGWLRTNAGRFGFIHRYAWEPWHYGYGSNPRDVPAQYERGSWEPPGGDHGRISHGLPSFVPERFHDPIARAALRWNVPMNLLAAQLYAESNFNPFAESAAGALGIAQFTPATAARYGLRNAFDATAAIDAQAHLMSDLVLRFHTVPLALAAYNAGPDAVARHGGVPAFAETRAYVAKVLGLLAGAGEEQAALEVRISE